jgi:hypothetical protein
MTGVRQLNVAAAICYVPFAQIAVIAERRSERVKSTLCCPSRSALRMGEKRQKAVFG